MDVEEAHKLLGLYAGAPREHVDDKYASMAGELQGQIERQDDPSAKYALQEKLKELQTAYQVCSGELPPTQIESPGRKGARGPLVLAFMAVTILLIASTSFVGVWIFDNARAKREVVENAEIATEARDAWERYRAGLKLDHNEESRAAMTAFDQAKQLQQDGDNAEAAVLYDEALDGFYNAFDAEDERLKREWKQDVVKFWETKLKGRFPFDPEAENEAAATDVETLLNPVDGRLWVLAEQRQALGEVEFGGRAAVAKSASHQKTLDAGAPLRDALFPNGTKNIDVPFEIAIVEQLTSLEVRFEFGGQTVLGRKQQEFTALRWTGDDGGARVGAWKRVVAREPARYTDFSQSDWGLLRLVQLAEFMGQKDGVYAWVVTSENMEGDADIRREVAARVLVKPGETNPFDLELYAAFDVS